MSPADSDDPESAHRPHRRGDLPAREPRLDGQQRRDRLQRLPGNTSGGESGTAIATGVITTSYTDNSVANGTTYYYKVTAANSAGTSGYSNEASATPVDNTGHILQTSTRDHRRQSRFHLERGHRLLGVAALQRPIPSGQTFSPHGRGCGIAITLLLFQITNNETLVSSSSSPWDGDDVEVYIDSTDAKPSSYGSTDSSTNWLWSVRCSRDEALSGEPDGRRLRLYGRERRLDRGDVPSVDDSGRDTVANNLIGFDVDFPDGSTRVPPSSAGGATTIPTGPIRRASAPACSRQRQLGSAAPTNLTATPGTRRYRSPGTLAQVLPPTTSTVGPRQAARAGLRPASPRPVTPMRA